MTETFGEISLFRGHRIHRRNAGGREWRYVDNGQLVMDDRPCGKCHMPRTPEGYDFCLGELKGVMNACCGHGDVGAAFVQFSPKNRISGEVALSFVRSSQLRERSQQLHIEEVHGRLAALQVAEAPRQFHNQPIGVAVTTASQPGDLFEMRLLGAPPVSHAIQDVVARWGPMGM